MSSLSHVSQVETEQELIKAFRPRDQKNVEPPAKVKYPLSYEYYLTWGDPSGHYRYLVLRRPRDQKLIGMIFKRGQQGSWISATRLCDWCHAFGAADQIDLLTLHPDARKTVGLMLCVDLSCLDKLDTVRTTTRRSFEQMASDLCARMVRCFENNLEDTRHN